MLAGVLVLGLVFLILRPLVELFAVAGEEVARTGVATLSDETTARAVVNSITVAVAVALVAVVAGTALAFVTERSASRAGVLRLAILSPLLVPPFVSALSWQRAYGPSGLIDDLSGWAFPGLMGPLGIVVVLATNAFPIAYLIVGAALRSDTHREREQAARIFGAKPRTALRTITLPLLSPALFGSGLLALVGGLNAFGVPAVLGTPAGFVTMTTRIYQDLARSARPEAFGRALFLAGVLVVLAVSLSSGAEVVLGRRGAATRSATGAGPISADRGGGQFGRAAAWVMLTLAVGLPLVALLLVALTKAVGLAPVPANWTMANFAEALQPRYLTALLRSVLLAGTAALVVAVLGTGAALASRWRTGTATGTILLMAFAVPGSTLAVAVLLAYGRSLRDTLLLILIAYLAKLWAVGHRSVQGSMAQISPELLWAARGSGASSGRALATILLPLLRPAIGAALLIVFLFGFHELTMSSLLYGPGTDTLAVAILNLQQVGDVPVTTALAVLLTVPALLFALPLLGRPRSLVARE